MEHKIVVHSKSQFKRLTAMGANVELQQFKPAALTSEEESEQHGSSDS